MINWEQGNNWTDPGTWTISGDYGGWFHVYAFTMTIGMLLAIGYSAYKFYKKGLSITQLAWGVIVIVPLSLFGASIFGKLNADGPGHNAGGVGFWGLFAFWQAGMSIHGGVYLGTLAGLIVYGIMGRYTKVSLWTYMDAIIPNILLGQAIGRWGNFFNHEVMGAPVGLVRHAQGSPADDLSPLHWLPKYIQINTQWQYNGPSTGVADGINGMALEHGAIYQMDPIFFYEFIAFVFGWALITFVLPNVGKWFGPKPWKLHPEQFQINPKEGWLNFVAPWRYTAKQVAKNPARQESYFVIWNQAFYKNVEEKENASYQKTVQKINRQYNPGTTKRRYYSGRALVKANNPDQYWITKVGSEAGAYFFVWNIVRFCLELQRPDDHLFIMYEKTLSLVLIMLTAAIGLLIMVLTQNVIAWFFRQPGNLYEKEYFLAPKLEKDYFIYLKNWISKLNTKSPSKKGNKSVKAKKDKKKLSKEEKAAKKLAELQKKKQ